MVTTGDDQLAGRIRALSRHGMSESSPDRYSEPGLWRHEIHEAGYDYKMTDLQAALGIHQLRRLDGAIERCGQIADSYSAAFADLPELLLTRQRPERKCSHYSYLVRVSGRSGHLDRDVLIGKLRRANVCTRAHFVPLHRQPYYRSRYGYQNDSFPVAEKLYRETVSLPLYPKMSDDDTQDVIGAVRDVVLASRTMAYQYPAAS